MSTSFFVVSLLLAFIGPMFGLQDASCNFADSRCEWHTDNDMVLTWNRNNEVFWNFGPSSEGKSGHHMELSMANQRVNATGRLLSGNLTGSTNQTCQLRLVYALEDHTACQLSVWLRTGANRTSLLMTLMDTYQFDKSPYIAVPCTADTYQIIIEGKKMSDKPCGAVFNKIGIVSVEFNVQQADKERNQVVSGDSEKGEEKSNNTQGSSDGGLSKGAAAAIAVVVNNVVVVVVVAAYCLVQKRAKKQGASEDRTSRAVAASFTSNSISGIRETPDQRRTQDDNMPSRVSTRENEYLTPVSEVSDSTNHNTRHRQQEMPANQNNAYERLDRNLNDNRPYEVLVVNRRD